MIHNVSIGKLVSDQNFGHSTRKITWTQGLHKLTQSPSASLL